MATRIDRDDTYAQIILARIARGRDAAKPISALAEELGWSRRQVERAAQMLADDGRTALCAGNEGIWLASSPNELKEYEASLRHRALEIFRRSRSIRAVRLRMMRYQTTLWGD